MYICLKAPVLPAFTESMQAFYEAKVKEENFADPATLGLINAWCAEETHNLIPQLLDELEGNTYLIHALYFKALWSSPFNPECTKDETFMNDNGSLSQVPTMSQTLLTLAYRGESFDALELDYQGGEYSMVIFLPKEGAGLSSVEKQLSPDAFGKLLTEMYLCDADVRLPKFRVENEHKLNHVLSRMGAGVLLSGGDYSLLSPNFVDAQIRVVQKTVADISEAGTEAAAATYVAIFTSQGPSKPVYPKIEFHVNRPFFFLIQKKRTGTMLFTGKVVSL